jgi:hypothetical protein
MRTSLDLILIENQIKNMSGGKRPGAGRPKGSRR